MSAVQTNSITELSNRDECPCCHAIKDLDEHHWQYKPEEVTIDICRSCHQYIHNNKRVREQGDNWQEECLRRLSMIDGIKNPGKGRLRDRFNVPESI